MLRRWVLIISLSVFLVGTLFGLLALREKFQHDQGEIRGTVLWIASEVNREYWRLLDVLSRYSFGDRTINHDDLLLRLDIFWSQLSTFKSGTLGHHLMIAGNSEATVAEIEATLTALEPKLNALQHGDAKAGAALRERLDNHAASIHQMIQRIDKSENTYFVDVFNQTEKSLDSLSLLVLSMSITGSFLIVLLIREKNRANRMATLAKDAEQQVREMNVHLELKVKERTAELEAEVLERKRNEEALLKSEERLNLALEAVSDAVWDWRIDTQEVHFNPGWYKIIGYQPYELPQAYATWINLIHPNDKDRAEQVVSRHLQIDEPFNMEFRMNSKDDKWKWIMGRGKVVERDSNGNAVRMIGTNVDITKRKKIESQLKASEDKMRQAQRMESIGNLAGGIAHDFNNLLMPILGFTELALDEVEKGSTIDKSLQEVYAASKRANGLVKQILAFARQSEEEIKPVKPSMIAKEVIKFIRSSIPTTIEIKKRIESDSCILGNPTQIHQVMMNLCTNASYAMEDDGGLLEVSLKDYTMADGLDWKKLKINPSNYLEIKVSDTGTGIPPEVIDSIFEPYFTTKVPGEGTGMGLAVVQGIVEACGGKITVDSILGKGTTFAIYLPIINQQNENQVNQSESLPTGTEKILFVDDEAPITNLGRQILEKLGYSVTTRESSIEAIELFRSKPRDFDLIITDMTMPHMTGDLLAIELKKIRPDIPVILFTGYSKRISEETALKIGINAFRYKPIIIVDLAETVRKLLDEAKSKKLSYS